MSSKQSLIVVVGIGTDVGKTVLSAAIAKKLRADYWKPIQCGYPSDSACIANIVEEVAIHKEAYAFKTPASPHYAASVENIKIDLEKIKPPKSTSENELLVVEAAGGLMVPLTQEFLWTDLLLLWKEIYSMKVILVSRHYLGSINHTLLSLFALKELDIPLHGIIFNGNENLSSEDVILSHAKVACLGRMPEVKGITKETLDEISKELCWEKIAG